MKIYKVLAIAGLMLLVAGCSSNAATKETVTLYKSATCGCCSGWKDHMVSNGYDVEVFDLNNDELSAIKKKYGIPRQLHSCHTAVIGDYFVEGHIPSKVVDELLEQTPPIDGIAMAGMPSGSPGMPGPKNEVWKIYSVKGSEISMFREL